MGHKSVNKYLVPVLGIGILAVTVFASKGLGLWVSTGNELVEKKVETGTVMTEDIKGWMTFQQVSDMFKVPLDEMYRGLNLPADTPADTKLKDMETAVPGFEPDAVREWLDKRNGGTSMAAVSKSEPSPAPSAVKATVPAETTKPAVQTTASVQLAAKDTGEEPPALTAQSTSNDIKGSMTIAQVCKAFNISPAVLKEKLGLPANLSDQRDFKSIRVEFNVEVTTVREAVAALTGK